MSGDWTRRRLLARLGSVGAVGALAGCPGDDSPASGSPTGRTERTTTGRRTTTAGEPTTRSPNATGPDAPDPSAYERVVDVVEAGGDPEGRVSIHSTLQSIDARDTLVRFPPGEYLVDEHWYVESFDRLGIYGPEATITTVPSFTGPVFGLGGDGGTDLAVRGLTFDFRQGNTGPRPLHLAVEDGLVVEGVSVRGEFDIDQDGMRFAVTDADGRGVVRGLRMPDGGSPRYRNTGVYVGDDHRGHLRFEDCLVDGFPDNGLYASPAVGRVDVVGGRYRNSGVSNVRVSGPATIRGVSVRCGEARSGVPNMRGIRLREGRDVRVENCRVVMDRVTGSDGAITCANWLAGATIRNTHVTVDADDVPALWAKSPESRVETPREYPLQVRGLTVDGRAAGGAAVEITDRGNTLVEDLCVCQPGRNRDGLHLHGSGGSVLRAASITVSGTPLVTEQSPLTREDLRLRSLASPGRVGNPPCDCS